MGPSLGKAQQRKDMTAIAVAHHIPYVAQAAASHWHDLSEKVERAARADGPAFLNVLTIARSAGDTSRGSRSKILNAAVDSHFWPLYEVVDGRYRLTYEPEEDPAGPGLARGQARFAHLLTRMRRRSSRRSRRRSTRDWAELLRRADADRSS